MELAEQKPIVSGLPAVHHFVWVRLVHAVVYALVRPELTALGLGHSLRPHAPVRRNESSDGEEQCEEVEPDRQEGPASASGLHGPRFRGA